MVAVKSIPEISPKVEKAKTRFEEKLRMIEPFIGSARLSGRDEAAGISNHPFMKTKKIAPS